MIDPLTAFAAVKGGIAAGKQIHSMAKDISRLFDSVDAAKQTHQKKKSSIFASSNEEAMDTWMRKQQAVEVEAELRELIVNTRGFHAYQDLLKIRRETLRERKEAERLVKIQEQERNEMILAVAGVLAMVSGLGAVIYWIGGRTGKW